MGQYYRIVSLKEKEGKYGPDYSIETVNPYDFDCGIKLMEFAYRGNLAVNRLIKTLLEETAKGNAVYSGIVGDYAEKGDIGEEGSVRRDMADEAIALRNNQFFDPDCLSNREFPRMTYDEDTVTVVNVSKKEYITIRTDKRWDSDKGQYVSEESPLALLLAVGNNRGGGDYRGINMEKVGHWAFDKLKAYKGDADFASFTRATYEFREE